MPELVSSAGSPALTGAVGTAALQMMGGEPDLGMLSGVVCGALVFLLRSKEPSRFKKLAYFLISLIGGYAVTPAARSAVEWAPAWFVAFICAASVLVIAGALLDWVEAALTKLLRGAAERLIDRIFGGGRHD
ncbi:putative holin [Cupriavidus sp. D384]|uniref:putative holin n=1 Tax=Cupriavidus sp. D384 TaxID=1538095 RepID=UPI0009ED964B|nr:putative holin [Cupriavidus sp. D384]